MGEGQRKTDFVCPICESKSYSENRVMNPITMDSVFGAEESDYSIHGYFCDGCSAAFLNPEKFSKVETLLASQEQKTPKTPEEQNADQAHGTTVA